MNNSIFLQKSQPGKPLEEKYTKLHKNNRASKRLDCLKLCKNDVE